MVTVGKIDKWLKRDKPPIHTKYKERENIWSSKGQEVDFKYYVCDYCGSAIRIKAEGQDGGEFVLPVTRLRRGKARVVAHNICLNKMLREIDEIFLKEK